MSFKDFLDKLKASADKLAELEIETKVLGSQGQPDRSMVTRINLIGSDILNEMDSEFVHGSLASLRDFHSQQVSKAESLLNARLSFVVTAFEKLGELIKDEDGEGDGAE